MEIKVGDYVRFNHKEPAFNGVEGVVTEVHSRTAEGIVTKLNGKYCYYGYVGEHFRIGLNSIEILTPVDNEDIWE